MPYAFNDDKSKAEIARIYLLNEESVTIPAGGRATVRLPSVDGLTFSNILGVWAMHCNANGSPMVPLTILSYAFSDYFYMVVYNQTSESKTVSAGACGMRVTYIK